MDTIVLVTFVMVSGFVASSIIGTLRETISGQAAGFKNGYISASRAIAAFFTVLLAGPFMAWRDMERWCREAKPHLAEVLVVVAFILAWATLIGIVVIDLAQRMV